jgi:DNA-binding NarL/FixJ family response regulator
MTNKTVIVATQENRVFDWIIEYIRPFAHGIYEILHTAEPDAIGSILKSHEIKKLFIEIDFFGKEITQELNYIRTLYPTLQVILFTVSDMQPEYCGFYASWGSDSFISLREKSSQIQEQMKAVFNGYNTITEDVLDYIRDNCRSEVVPPHFTAQESEVVKLIGKEKTRKEIAEKLDISESTVNKHIESMFEKCEVNNIVGLVKAGFTAGIITMGDMLKTFSPIKQKEKKCMLY